MISKRLAFISNFFKSDDSKRDSNVAFHAIFSVVLKFFSVVINFSLVPLTINFFGVDNYGLYTALMVISGWLVFLDIGMSNSFRNKVAFFHAANDVSMTKTFISTTYAIFGLIGVTFFALFLILSPYVDFTYLLGQVPETDNITQILIIIIFFTVFNFANRLITLVLMATQKASVPVLLSFVTNLIILFLLYFLNGLINPTLLNLILIYFLPMTLVWVFTSLILFFNTFSEIRPSISYIKFKYFADLIRTGSQFFIIQVEGIVIYTSTSFIILKLFSTTDVATYAVAVRFFSIIQLVFALVMNVYWSAISEAIAQKDFAWVKKSILRLNKIFIVIAPISLIMALFSNEFFNLWLGDTISVPPLLAYSCCISAFLATFNSIYENALNGAEKIGILSAISFVNLIIYFPLIYYFVSILGFHVEGVIFAVITCQIFTAITATSRMIIYIKYQK